MSAIDLSRKFEPLSAKSSPVLKFTPKGRPSNTAQLSKLQPQSSETIYAALQRQAGKRQCTVEADLHLDKAAPPQKTSRPIDSKSHSDMVDNQPKTVQELFTQFAIWRTEDKGYLVQMKEELVNKIEATSAASNEKIEKVNMALSKENAALRGELEAVKKRLAVLESSSTNSMDPDVLVSPLSQTSLAKTERTLIRNSIDAIEKHLRNNIIIRGLKPNNQDVRKDKENIKATVNCSSNKEYIMKRKSQLKVPVYIGYDLTPEEEKLAKKLRDEAKILRANGKSVKIRPNKLIVDGSPYIFDMSLNKLVSSAKASAANTMMDLSNSLCEAWLSSKHKLHPPAGWQAITVEADKKSDLPGRASGGLAVLTPNGVTYNLLHSSSSWIIGQPSICNLKIVVVSVYLKPTADLCSQLSSLVGLLGELDQTLLFSTLLNPRRSVLDLETNKRGSVLLEFLEQNGFILLNGRCQKDIPGGYTYISKLGKSTSDLIWVNLLGADLINNMWVESMTSDSDHLPVTI
ncbi:hypothetical protein KQX54_012689 [Cotesia glomerata]|uniref:Endonuclease/exonuclease/phosphatase domain-containing protein n=1 Tax=Cotesia glomerata TaxID=32391 RepID=A0AAV7J7P1_COTGL|nr:hypothetical protein KQX54_012689 [Cotesia glomerata]